MSGNFHGTYHDLKPEDVRVVVGEGGAPWLELGDVHYCIGSEDVFKAIIIEAAAGVGYCIARTKEKADE